MERKNVIDKGTIRLGWCNSKALTHQRLNVVHFTMEGCDFLSAFNYGISHNPFWWWVVFLV